MYDKENLEILAKYLSPLGTPVQSIPTGDPSQLEQHYADWLREIFPDYVSDKMGNFTEFSEYHDLFWNWLWNLSSTTEQDFVGIWPRGGAKSTSAELACAYVAATRKRRYCLYVCDTQERADDHVQNVASMLEGAIYGYYYPSASQRSLSKFGDVKGWRRNRLRTSSGFTIDALGLDSAIRGAKVDQDRPDLIIIDDIDELTDSPKEIEQKINQLTRKLLPAGSPDMVVIFIQNLIREDGIASKLVNKQVDFLRSAIISGPYPALYDFKYEQTENGTKITSGKPSWEGYDLPRCQREVNKIGLSSFLTEHQQLVNQLNEGLFKKVVFKHCESNELPEFVKVVAWGDPAVTDTQKSDSHGIQIDGIDDKNHIYRLFSWEEKASPREALIMLITQAVHFKAMHCGVETDQGGDTWEELYYAIADDLRTELKIEAPPFVSEKAGMHVGNKVHRASQMLASYQRGEIIHVYGTHEILERALGRFPNTKPFDLVDASYWSWNDLYVGTPPFEVAEEKIIPIAQRRPRSVIFGRKRASLFNDEKSRIIAKIGAQ